MAPHLISLILLATEVLYVLIIINAILHWVPQAQWHPIGSFLYGITEPLVKPFRAFIPIVHIDRYYLDLSPLAALAAVWVLRAVLIMLVMLLFH